MRRNRKKPLIFIMLLMFLCSICGILWVYTQEEIEASVYKDVEQYISSKSTNSVDNVLSYQFDYDWDELLKTNKNIIGWLYLPGNDKINFPVVKSFDNDYYLNHDYTGKWNANGCAFIDYRTTEESQNVVIHGHNMNRSSTRPIFTTLTDYWNNEEYFDSHRTLYYTKANGMTMKYKVVGVAWYNIAKQKEFTYSQRDFETEEDFRSWLEYVKKNSLFYDLGDTNIDYCKDEIITLSTCYRINGAGKNGRLSIFCVNLTNDEITGGE